ncbi:unnamed protein product, partial [Ixodes pacificus]
MALSFSWHFLRAKKCILVTSQRTSYHKPSKAITHSKGRKPTDHVTNSANSKRKCKPNHVTGAGLAGTTGRFDRSALAVPRVRSRPPGEGQFGNWRSIYKR